MIITVGGLYSLTDFEDQTHGVEIEVRLPHRRHVALVPDVVDRLELRTRREGVSVETLVNLWLVKRLEAEA